MVLPVLQYISMVLVMLLLCSHKEVWLGHGHLHVAINHAIIVVNLKMYQTDCIPLIKSIVFNAKVVAKFLESGLPFMEIRI